MAIEWSENVNTRFYGQDGTYVENWEEVEYKSGRRVYYLKNTLPAKSIAVNLMLNDRKAERVDGKTEFEWFLYWYEYVCKSGTETFYLTDLISGNSTREYRLTEVPTWEGQAFKEVTLTIEEV